MKLVLKLVKYQWNWLNKLIRLPFNYNDLTFRDVAEMMGWNKLGRSVERANDETWLSFKNVMDPQVTMVVSILSGYGSIPINTIFRGMNIHLPAILMFTRGTRFWHTAKSTSISPWGVPPFRTLPNVNLWGLKHPKHGNFCRKPSIWRLEPRKNGRCFFCHWDMVTMVYWKGIIEQWPMVGWWFTYFYFLFPTNGLLLPIHHIFWAGGSSTHQISKHTFRDWEKS